MNTTFKLALAAAVASLGLVGTAQAQHHGGGGFRGGAGFHGGGWHGSPGWHGGGYRPAPVYRGGYYRGGYGYRGGWGWWGPAAAIGLTVAALPYAYSTYYYGGVPYYYADGAYYTGVSGGYQVVTPPDGLVQQAPSTATTAPSAPAPVVYPRNNQSAQQQETDQRACNTWATTQPAAMNDASVFQRSVEACMDGRGYTVR